MAVATAGSGTSVLARIADWSAELPIWQQDALRRIVEHCDITPDDIAQLVVLCKDARCLVNGEQVPALRPLKREHIPNGVPAGHAVAIRSISHIQNVNAICSEQVLTLAKEGITVVFGYNASGKSGYGRVLRRACRARAKGPPIIPNVMKAASLSEPSARIAYTLDGQEQPPEQWIDGKKPIEPLGAVSFFDTQCATVHVGDKNDIAFTPFGLDVLPKLAAACKEVQRQLDSERRRLSELRPKFFQSPIATGATVVGKALSALTAGSNHQEFEAICSLTDAERARTQELSRLLAHDPRKLGQELRNRSRRLRALAGTLTIVTDALSEAGVARIRALTEDCNVKVKAAEAAAHMQFSEDPLQKIGESAWRELWESARRYSQAVYRDQEFPVVNGAGTVCVLCQQPLSEDAMNRFTRFEQFIRDDTAIQAIAARALLDTSVRQLEALGMRDSSLRDQIEEVRITNAELALHVRREVAGHLYRYRWIRAACKSGYWSAANSAGVVTSIAAEVLELSQRLENNAVEVEKSANEVERKRLETELAELQAREWLATVIGDVKDHINRLAEIRTISDCIDDTKTNKITAKSKTLAKEYVTDHLRDAFAREIQGMHQGVRRVNVELAATAGEYGSSFYRVQIVGANKASIEAVVSEGEHRCIALAGFLAELATEQSRSAIIFDDPVTSLDHHWRHCFSRRLIEEAATRQVIIFTHDVVLLHDLMDGARSEGVPIELRRVQAKGDHCGIVSDDLPWVAQPIVQRIDGLEKQTRSAKTVYDANDDDAYENAVRTIYSKLRATVEQTVEQCVFRRVVIRHRDYIDVSNLKFATVLTLDDCNRLQKLFKKCCDVTDAHDRAELRSFGLPSPDDALNDLAELRAIVDELKDRQKPLSSV